jgi:thiamine-phosphate pyrophosphorylase
MKSLTIDYSLYLVTDRPLARGRDLLDVIQAAVRGGVTIVQLREKTAPTREILALARELRTRIDVPVIVNDRVDVALAAGVAGVHVGQNDMPYGDARALMGPDALIGVSVESMADAEVLEAEDADYLGLSPVFPTPTKTDVETSLGLYGVREIRRRSCHRLVGIGGLDESNAGEVIRAGADGIAVVSAIMSARDPEAAARRLRSVIEAARD